MVEVWRAVGGFEGLYEVSSLGRVRSLERVVPMRNGCRKTVKERILRPALVQGYPTLALWRDNRQTMARVHRLVCAAFHGPQPSPAHEVAHTDGNPANANYENLRWALHSENEADKAKHGTKLSGEKHKMAKLTNAQVQTIRESSKRGCDLATEFGVSRATICIIRQGKVWKEALPLAA